MEESGPLIGSKILTVSRMRAARTCHRLHFYKYVAGYRFVEQFEALRFGSLFHSGLEAWWLEKDHGNKLHAGLVAMLAAKGPDTDSFEFAKAEVLLMGYDARWNDEQRDELETIGAEVVFETELRNPRTGAASRTYRLAGKLDALVREIKTGRYLLVEHKTSGSDISHGTDYWKRLRLDPQVSTYYEGGTSLGYAIAGCLYDVVGKPAIRPHKATPPEKRRYTKAGTLDKRQRETDESIEEYRARLIELVSESPDKFFARGEVVRLEEEIDESMFDVWQLARQVRENELADRYPKNPDSCVRYSRTCEFFPVCTRETSLSDATLYQKVDTAHPELANELGE